MDNCGIVRHASVNDLAVGRNVDEVLRLVHAFQYTDKCGEVCPASWTPGSKTVKILFSLRHNKVYKVLHYSSDTEPPKIFLWQFFVQPLVQPFGSSGPGVLVLLSCF